MRPVFQDTLKILAMIALLAGVLLYLHPWKKDISEEARDAATHTSIQAIRAGVLEFAANQHHLPNTLDEATVATSNTPAIFEKEHLHDAWGHPFQYKLLSSTNFEVRSAGRDGKVGTKDDLAD